MKKLNLIKTIPIILSLIILCLLPTKNTNAQTADQYLIGQIISINKESISTKIIKGEQKGEILKIEHHANAEFQEDQKYKINNKIVIGKIVSDTNDYYFVYDIYRYSNIIWGVLIFLLIIISFSGFQGFRSIIGLGLSIVIIYKFIVPSLLNGWNALFISITGALMISVSTLYLAHGFKRRTTVALISTIITFTISTIFAILAVSFTKLTGLGTEDAMFLIGDTSTPLNLKGILLGGIIIGMLGVLDDITTSQAAAIDEIHKANRNLSTKELYKHGISIGKEHIASLVNTLALAYAGASLPLFLLFTINKSDPSWVILNSEFIAEEIIRTIVGSSALILAVPITTLIAVYSIKYLPQDKSTYSNSHHH